MCINQSFLKTDLTMSSSEISSTDCKQDEVRQRVRRVRRASHIAQGPVAAGADLDTSTLCRWELGQVTLSPKQIENIQASLLAEIEGRLNAIREGLAVVAS